mmetsp:Transcript_9799/g.8329  ORF Transcript_9799/g.8329 Transcript_9799/m.8329 type:complete len:93 (+) Transcript_9799:24-302(+)
MSALDGRASNQLKRLLQGKDAVEDAGWAHKAESAIPWSKPLHFIQQPEPFSTKIITLKTLMQWFMHISYQVNQKPHRISICNLRCQSCRRSH